MQTQEVRPLAGRPSHGACDRLSDVVDKDRQRTDLFLLKYFRQLQAGKTACFATGVICLIVGLSASIVASVHLLRAKQNRETEVITECPQVEVPTNVAGYSSPPPPYAEIAG